MRCRYEDEPSYKRFLEVCFFLMILSVIIEEGFEIRQEMRAKGDLKTALAHMYCSSIEGLLIQLVDLAIIVSSFVLVGYWAAFDKELHHTMDKLDKLRRPDGIATYDDNDNDVWSEFRHEVAHIAHEMERIIYELRTIKEIALFFVFALITRFYKTWAGIPAL